MAESTVNIVDDGDFHNIPFNGQQEVILAQLSQELGGWRLYGPATHAVRFMAHGNGSVLPGLPHELQDARVNFACLSANGQSGLIGHRTNRVLQPGQRVRVTWYAAANAHSSCGNGNFFHTIQFAAQVEHASGNDSPVDGALYQLPRLSRVNGWQKQEATFNVVGGAGYRYLSFKGDPSAGSCGVVISGIRAIIVDDHSHDSITIDDATTLYVTVGTTVGAIRAKVRRDGLPFQSADVRFEITEDASGTGTAFVSGDAFYTKTTDSDGIALIPAGTILAGAKPGTVVLKATVGAYSKNFQRIVVQAGHVDPLPGATVAVKAVSSEFASGDRQHTLSKRRFLRPLRVLAVDKAGGPARSGSVTFVVKGDGQGTSGYISSDADANWNAVSAAGKSTLDVGVVQGQASAWLWGEHSEPATRGVLTVDAHVTGAPSAAVTFHEYVWASAEAWTIEKFGDDQQVANGKSPSELKVRVRQKASSASVVAGAWLHWTTNALKFHQVSNADSVHWENSGSVWVRTDENGFASAPVIDPVTVTTSREAQVRVASFVAEDAVFKLRLVPAEAASEYSIEWEDEGALPIDEETPRTLVVKNPAGVPVGGVEVHVDVSAQHNEAGVTVSATRVTTATSPGANVGHATVHLTAQRVGTARLTLRASKARTTEVTVVAQAGATRKSLKFTGPNHLELIPGLPSAVNPIIVYVDPPDPGISRIHFEIVPRDSHGELLAKVNGGHWRSEGELSRQPDGRFHIEQLKFRNAELTEDDAKTYSITFSASSVVHAAFTVTAAEAPILDVHPEHSGEVPIAVDAQSTVEHDQSFYVLAYRMAKGRRVPAAHVPLHFTITISQPVGADPSEVVFQEGMATSVTASTDSTGKCMLPPVKIQNWRGSFEVGIHVGGHAAAAGVWHFRADTAKPPVALKFNNERGPGARLRPTTVYYEQDPVDFVTAYSNSAMLPGTVVHSGSVAFSISTSGGNPTGASFMTDEEKFPDGAPVTARTAPIKWDGTAAVPTLRAVSPGKLTLVASIGGIASISKTFDVR